MTRVVRWTGYVLIAAGVLLFLASYFATYERGGWSAIAERFFNPFGDALLVGLCVGPGLLLLGWAERRERKS